MMRKTGRIVTVLCACGAGRWGNAFLTSTTRISRTNVARSQLGWTVPPQMAVSGSASGVNINKDVVVIGGGLAGLSTALELAKRGRQVTVLSRSRAEAAAEAAGGMIAPQAERLESGPYLDLCLSSRAMYADWVSSIEAIAGLGGEKAETHFWSCGGFVSPAFEGDAVHLWSPPPEGGQAHWIGREQALEMEPSLSADIVGAWWFPQDMSIDAQRMFTVLEQACGKAGVEILQGTAAASLVYSPEGSSVDAVVLEDGRQLHTNAVVSAAGAWMRELMPVPMLPHKGQMMSLRQPEGGRGEGSPKQGGGLGLTRVFFAEGCYIIPKRDGRVVVGSTVEVGEYGLHNTPAGMKQIIDAAVKVCPALADLAIERTWAGLRPVTPDTFPVLGASPRCPNLFVAGGYWRNGVLLAPKTAQLVADAVCGCLAPEDDVFSRAFSMDRFSVAGIGAAPHTPVASRNVNVRPSLSSSLGAGAGGLAEASLATDLAMERAALEGANDGAMLDGVGGLFGTEADAVDEEDKETAAGIETGFSSTGGAQEAVNDYDASERFSEDSLKEARMANRLVQEGSDARLEELFGEDPEEEALPQINSWEEGAEEMAKLIGAEMVEMEVDVPEGMSIEEALSQHGPIVKVLWENPNGEEIEVPRGMNLGTMVEAGLISPLGVEGDNEERGASAGAAGAGKQAPAGVFDPTAVRGAEERSAEVSDLYAKVIANKAKARAEAEGQGAEGLATMLNGDTGSEGGSGATRAKSWLGDIFGIGESSGGGESGGGAAGVHSGHEQEPSAAIEVDTQAKSEPTADGEVKEMVGYDFILQDRDDTEGKVAMSARAASRDAPEGEEAWASFEDIANEAMASVGGMESVEYLPP